MAEHLDYIQNAINRMANNSFLIKGWAITFISLLFILSVKESNIWYLILTFLPLFCFWGLDAYYLRQEKLFRKLYDLVRKGKVKEPFIMRWIENTMKDCDCIIVLIGSETANRPWVDYEISKAWEMKKGILGIYIHNLPCPRTGKSHKGLNPFDKIFFTDGTPLSSKIKCYDPNPLDAYNDIKTGIQRIVELAIQEAKQRN